MGRQWVQAEPPSRRSLTGRVQRYGKGLPSDSEDNNDSQTDITHCLDLSISVPPASLTYLLCVWYFIRMEKPGGVCSHGVTKGGRD